MNQVRTLIEKIGVSSTYGRIETLDVSDETSCIPSSDLDWLDWFDGHRDEPVPFELTPKAWLETHGRRA